MNLRETFRYLGYHGQEPDEAAKNLAVICWKELEQAATPDPFIGSILWNLPEILVL